MSETTENAKETKVDVDLTVFGKELVFHPNVHAILVFSALALALYLTKQLVFGGHMSAVVAAEILHFLGWVWVETPLVFDVV